MKKKKKVWVFTLWPRHNPCNSLRFNSPLSFFPEDFEFIFAHSFKALASLGVVPDAVVFHRILYPFTEACKIVSFCRSHGVLTGMEVDDYITGLPSQHPSYAGYNALRARIEEFMRSLDFMTVTTERLKNFLLPCNKNIYVMPNLVDLRIWDIKVRQDGHPGVTVIGYAGSEPHGYDFRPVIPAIRHIAEKYSGSVAFKFIGYFPSALKGVQGIFHAPSIEHYSRYARFVKESAFDIALAPLEDNTYSQGKSNIKFLEYSMCSSAGIYSRVGAYADTVSHEQNGILTGNSSQEWIDAMDRLIKDRGLRNRLAAAAYAHVSREYSLQARYSEWVQGYRSIMASSVKPKDTAFSFAPAALFGQYLAYAQFRDLYYFLLRQALSLMRFLKRKDRYSRV